MNDSIGNRQSEIDNGTRLPPHSEEAERGLLGSVLMDPVTVLAMAINEQKLVAESFHSPAHRTLWETFCTMFSEAEQINDLTVGQKLKDAGLFEKVGGDSFLMGLMDLASTSAFAQSYAEIVRSKWIVREAAWIAREIQSEAFTATDAEQFLASIPERFLSIVDSVSNEPERIDAYNTVIEEVTAAKERQVAIREGRPVAPPPYVATGFEQLDKSMGGGLRNYLYILGGEQSTGKTTIVSQIMKHVAQGCRSDEQVLIFSMDADREEHAARDMTRASRVSLPKIMAGYAKKDQMKRFTESAERIAALPIVIDEESSTLAQQQSKARMLSMKKKLKLIVVDYIQLSRIGDHKVDMQENYALSSIAKAYKRLARELGCPVIALSQFNNAGKRDMSRFAMMGDLRGSGELAEIAHGILLLSKDRDLVSNGRKEHSGAPEENGIRPVWIDIAKNKNGPIGRLESWLYTKYFFFTEAEEGSFAVAAEKAERGEAVHGGYTDHDDEAGETPAVQEEIIL